jgi:hypothetical protein
MDRNDRHFPCRESFHGGFCQREHLTRVGDQSLISKDSLSLTVLAKTSSIILELDCMKTSLSSIPTRRIARALLLTLTATAACTFFSACVGHQARVDNRQDRRADRQERRADRQAPDDTESN